MLSFSLPTLLGFQRNKDIAKVVFFLLLTKKKLLRRHKKCVKRWIFCLKSATTLKK